MAGFRLCIAPDDTAPGSFRHFSGNDPAQSGAVFKECPNCATQMFPALNLDFSDPKLSSLDLWPPQFMNILFCAACGFYMEPYWIRYVGTQIEVVGGDRSSIKKFQNIETPFRMRGITLQALIPDDDPDSETTLAGYRNRTLDEGVYHQIGGRPIRGQDVEMVCLNCRENLRFAGVLNYDDLNVPLYEDGHRPVALIIGDGDCINFYTCRKCQIIGLQWVQ